MARFRGTFSPAPSPSNLGEGWGEGEFTGGWKKRGQIFINRLADGQPAGTFDPGPTVGGVEATGWIDILTGITAHRRADGSYLVFVEEDYRGKSIVYHWTP